MLTEALLESIMTHLLYNLSRSEKLRSQGKFVFKEIDDVNKGIPVLTQNRLKGYLKDLGDDETQVELYFPIANGWCLLKIEKRVKSYPRMERNLGKIVEMKKQLTDLPHVDEDKEETFGYHVFFQSISKEEEEEVEDKYSIFAREVIQSMAEQIGKDLSDETKIKRRDTVRLVHPLFCILEQVTSFIDPEEFSPSNVEYCTLAVNLMLISAKEKEEWAVCNNIACAHNFVKVPVVTKDVDETFKCHYIGRNCRVDPRLETISQSLLNGYLNKEKEGDMSESTKKRKRGKGKDDKDDYLKEHCEADLHRLDMFPLQNEAFFAFIRLAICDGRFYNVSSTR